MSRPDGARYRLRPARRDDLCAFYGGPPPRRVIAVVAETLEGATLGVGGLEFADAGLRAFMDVAPGVDPKRNKRAAIAGARAVLERARRLGRPVFACRDTDLRNSVAFLRHFGFAPSGETDEEEIWRWAD